MRSRVWVGFGALLVIAAIGAFSGAGSATAAEISTSRCLTGRSLCLDVRTYEGITASETSANGARYTYVEWTLTNQGKSTLTQLKAHVTLSEATTAFVLPLPAGCTGSARAVDCTYANLAATDPPASVTTRIYFKTADAPATSNDITVTGSAKEGPNDNHVCPTDGSDPNCDTVSLTLTNSYELLAGSALTWALDGNRFHLPSNDGLSSFDFTSANATPFLTTFKASNEGTTYCFSTVPCFERTLQADTTGASGFGSSNPVVFYARLFDPPGGVNEKSLTAIHTYDDVSLTSASSRLKPAAGTPSFARMDGVSFGAAAATTLNIAAGKYFVVGYQSSDNSFRIATTKGGTPLTLEAGGVLGAPIRIIGDQADERSTTGCTTTYATTIAVPSICAKKVSGIKALDSWVWDSGNGWVVH